MHFAGLFPSGAGLDTVLFSPLGGRDAGPQEATLRSITKSGGNGN
jgi:hypothetical protein